MATVQFALTGDVSRNSRALRQIATLREAGLEVVVLHLGPEGEREGVRYVRVGHEIGAGVGFYAANYLAFLRASASHPADLYHASDLYVLPAMAGRAKTRRKPFTFDARERYPFTFGTVGKPWASRFWAMLEGYFTRRAAQVFTVNASIAREMAGSYGIAAPVVVPNVPPFTGFPDPAPWLFSETGFPREEPIVLYHGALTPYRGTFILLEAFTQLSFGRLVFLGSGPLSSPLRQRAEALGVMDRVAVLEAVPPSRLLPVIAAATVGVVYIEPVCRSYELALPNKLFECLAAGVPVLAADLPEMRSVVNSFGVGQCVAPNSVDVLAEALDALLRDPERQSRYRAAMPAVFDTFDAQAAQARFRSAILAALG